MITVSDVRFWDQTPVQTVDIGDILIIKSRQSIIRGLVVGKDRLSQPTLRIQPQTTILGPEVMQEVVTTYYPMFSRWIPTELYDFADRFLIVGHVLISHLDKLKACHYMVQLTSIHPLRAKVLAVYGCDTQSLDDSEAGIDISDWTLRFPTQSELRTYSVFMD